MVASVYVQMDKAVVFEEEYVERNHYDELYIFLFSFLILIGFLLQLVVSN